MWISSNVIQLQILQANYIFTVVALLGQILLLILDTNIIGHSIHEDETQDWLTISIIAADLNRSVQFLEKFFLTLLYTGYKMLQFTQGGGA